MNENLIVQMNMKSGKKHLVESKRFVSGELESFVNDITSNDPIFIGVSEELSIRWSEVESIEDVSFLELNKTDGYIKVDAAEIKVGHSKEDIEKIGAYFAKEFEKRK